MTDRPADIPFDRLVDLAKLRWRMERDYQELKQEVGLGHFGGRQGTGCSLATLGTRLEDTASCGRCREEYLP
jgi:SRSO17 transposase